MVKGDIYWAVVLRHRWARWFDSGELWLLKGRNGDFDGPAVRRIAGVYGVARGLRLLPKEAKTGRASDDEVIKARRSAEFASVLNGILQDMPEEMVERSGYLAGSHHKIEKFVHDRQLSALSKFAWFANPSGWTMFDTLASGAIKARTFDDFYRKLHERGFLAIVEDIRGPLTQARLQDIHAERVIDQYLLLRGSSQIENARQVARGYLECLPTGEASQLKEAAEGVAAAVRGHSWMEGVGR